MCACPTPAGLGARYRDVRTAARDGSPLGAHTVCRWHACNGPRWTPAGRRRAAPRSSNGDGESNLWTHGNVHIGRLAFWAHSVVCLHKLRANSGKDLGAMDETIDRAWVFRGAPRAKFGRNTYVRRAASEVGRP
jgi:hypothetical protein